DLPACVEMAPGVNVRHVNAGPFEGLAKEDLPAQMCAFTTGVLRAEAANPTGYYDLVHSHYWLSGQVGWLAKERWGGPLVPPQHPVGEGQKPPRPAGRARRAGNGAVGRPARPHHAHDGEGQEPPARSRRLPGAGDASDRRGTGRRAGR